MLPSFLNVSNREHLINSLEFVDKQSRARSVISGPVGWALPTFGKPRSRCGTRPGSSHGHHCGASNYYLYVVDDTTVMPAMNEPNVGTATTFTPAANAVLTPGHSYTWYVCAFSTNSQSFAYVNTGATFTLAGLAAPALAGPTGQIFQVT